MANNAAFLMQSLVAVAVHIDSYLGYNEIK